MNFRSTLIAGLLASLVLVVAVAAGPVLADKGGKPHTADSTTSSITINEHNPYLFGEAVSFTVTYPSMNEDPRVRVLCFQNGEMVYQYSQGTEGVESWVPAFILWSATWAANGGGAADCVADLYYFTWQGHTQTSVVYLAHTAFAVTG